MRPGRQISVELGIYFKDQRFAYNGSNLEYRGAHFKHNAGTDDELWQIWKYSYDGSDNISRIEGPLEGTWDNRALLSWS